MRIDIERGDHGRISTPLVLIHEFNFDSMLFAFLIFKKTNQLVAGVLMVNFTKIRCFYLKLLF